MTFILTRGTGQRLTDQRMAATRPQYADYAARTSGFIPLPPRRHASGGAAADRRETAAAQFRRYAARRAAASPPDVKKYLRPGPGALP